MNLVESQKKLAEDGVSDHYRYFIDTYRIHDFKEETLLKEYIDFNTDRRKDAKNEFEKHF
jgi:hypothetical protein